MKTIDHLEKIILIVKEHGICDKYFKLAKKHLEAVGSLLHTTMAQTTIFALFLDQFGEYSVSVNEIATSLKCNKIQLIRYLDDIEVLKDKKLILQVSNSFNLRKRDNRIEYIVPLDVIDALRKDIEYVPKKKENLTPNEFYDCADELFNELEEREIDKAYLTEELNYLLENNKHICFVKKVRENKLGNSSKIIMLNLCTALVNQDKEKVGMDNISEVLEHHDYRMFQRGLKSKDHELYKKGFVEYDFYKGLVDTENCLLSKKAKEEFLADVDLLDTEKNKGKSFIPTKNISVKKLYYNENNSARISELTSLLREDNFKTIQERLKENGMRTGFACIFSGLPGTGKTETVYQIAKQTGRDIMLVNIAETKSCWFGESEKLIKEVFDQYKDLVKKAERLIPILLFNEADAVLGKRREISSSNSGGVAQTENAIQNIILQEMEDLNGILIATTNMTTNLDKAFERRFLYKIEFDKPDAEAKKSIWQSLLPSLSDQDALSLARQFDFSGGQIENIARKSMVSLILKGSTPKLSDLQIFCKEEMIEKTSKRIGFGT